MPLSIATTRDELFAYDPAAAKQRQLREDFLHHLEYHGQSAWVKNESSVHFTASALVCNAERTHVLLMLHHKMGRWLQMGGHIEPGDDSLAGAAVREAREESGIASLEPPARIVDLDAHDVGHKLTCATHLDVRYIITAPPGAKESANDESDDLAWFALDEVKNISTDNSVLRLLPHVA